MVTDICSHYRVLSVKVPIETTLSSLVLPSKRSSTVVRHMKLDLSRIRGYSRYIYLYKDPNQDVYYYSLRQLGVKIGVTHVTLRRWYLGYATRRLPPKPGFTYLVIADTSDEDLKSLNIDFDSPLYSGDE
jgi:hypothetical protein